MFRIEYYRDRNGRNEFEDFYNELFLKGKNNKSCRILYRTFTRFLTFLKNYGTKSLPADYAKHIIEDIW